MRPPEIENSTEEDRRQYIKNTFTCIADCDMRGLCTVFHGKDPEDYMHNTFMTRFSWMQFIIIMAYTGISERMSQAMCIREIITIRQVIPKAALP